MKRSAGLHRSESTVRVSLVIPEVGLPRARRVHHFHELVYIAGGGPYTVKVAGQTWQGRDGDLFYYPAGTRHEGRTREDRTVRLLVAQWTDRDTSWRERKPFHAHDTQRRILSALNWMRDTEPAETNQDAIIVRSLLNALLHEIDKIRTNRAVLRDPAVDAAKILKFGLQHRFSLSSLADQVGLSPFYLNRLFKKAFGIPPMKRLQQLRLEKALHLLLATRLPLKAIALRVGYRNESHLAALLKREHGISPGRMRRGMPE